MIKVEKGAISIKGFTPMVCAEFSLLAKHMREVLGEELYANCLIDATKTDEELKSESEKFKGEFLDRFNELYDKMKEWESEEE